MHDSTMETEQPTPKTLFALYGSLKTKYKTGTGGYYGAFVKFPVFFDSLT